jgi:hypothetical protein
MIEGFETLIGQCRVYILHAVDLLLDDPQGGMKIAHVPGGHAFAELDGMNVRWGLYWEHEAHHGVIPRSTIGTPGWEFEALTPSQQEDVRAVVRKARDTRQYVAETIRSCGSEVYAYPNGEVVSWGLNAPGQGFAAAHGQVHKGDEL